MQMLLLHMYHTVRVDIYDRDAVAVLLGGVPYPAGMHVINTIVETKKYDSLGTIYRIAATSISVPATGARARGQCM